jgi:hypothetical protein
VLGNSIILYIFTNKKRETQQNPHKTTLNCPSNIITANYPQKKRESCHIGNVIREVVPIIRTLVSLSELILTRRSRGIVLDLHSGGARFELRSGHRFS